VGALPVVFSRVRPQVRPTPVISMPIILLTDFLPRLTCPIVRLPSPVVCCFVALPSCAELGCKRHVATEVFWEHSHFGCHWAIHQGLHSKVWRRGVCLAQHIVV
jgi:hypothetical protein